jgi:glucose-1-phosphate cytidylyltransferase
VKVVILAGGYGSRFGKVTDFLPKPMIPVGPFPILWHIMRYYAHFGHSEFIICTGYKSEVIKEFFLNLEAYSNDFTIDFSGSPCGEMVFHRSGESFAPTVTLAYTGEHSMTGSRIKQIKHYLGDDPEFLLTYGDGVTDMDLDQLISFHRGHGKMATLTAVYPPARFGDLHFQGDNVTRFAEKHGQQGAMVNGGYYVFNRQVLEYLDVEPGCVLEKDPLNRISQEGQLMAFRHHGYWQCMDTTRDLEGLQESWNSCQAPWKVWGATDRATKCSGDASSKPSRRHVK